MNIVLCGMMGSGKTSLGKRIAERLGYAWADSDFVIEERYGSISTLFQTRGEEYFRRIEREIIAELAKKEKLVLSTGGGVLLDESNQTVLKKTGKILFLRATKETLLCRLQGDKNRPLLQGGELEEKIERLLTERTPVYERVADGVLDVDGYTKEENANRAFERIKTWQV